MILSSFARALRPLMMASVSVGVVILATACASTTETIVGPDGTPHQLISCGTVRRCYAKATEACGGKYQIVNTSNEPSADLESSHTTTKLLVKCLP